MNLFAAAVAAGIMLAGSSTPPFPPPKLISVTDALKCDWGAVVSAGGSEVVINTPPGTLTLQVGSDLKVVGADGRPGAHLQAGQRVRAYYFVDNGAKAKEIDVVVGPDGT